MEKTTSLSICALMFYPCLFCPSDNVWRSRASVRTLVYSFHTFLDYSTNINRKVRAPRRVSSLGTRNKFKIVTWTKQTWIIHQCTPKFGHTYCVILYSNLLRRVLVSSSLDYHITLHICSGYPIELGVAIGYFVDRKLLLVIFKQQAAFLQHFLS